MDQRPRVALVAPWPPYPFDGGSKRIHSLCSLLPERFRFTLATFRPRVRGLEAAARDLAAESAFLRPVFERVDWFDPPEPSAPARVGGVRLAEDMRRCYSPALEKHLEAVLSRGEADLLHVEYDLMAVYGRLAAGIPKVLTQHDMGGLSLFRSYFREMSGWGRLKRLPDWLARVRLMRRAGSWFDRVVVMTEPDRKALSRLMPAGRIRAVPTGVDLDYFRPPPAGRGEGGTLVFVGHYPHFPNEDAVLWFSRRVLPLIQREKPGVRFLAVGSSPTPALLEEARKRPALAVTGTVPDVRPYLARADVFVAPIRLGLGIKGKILEAWAMGRPVAATSLAAKGLDAVPGRDLLTADSSEAFARQTLRLLGSDSLRRELGKRGRRIVEERFDWRVLAGRLGGVYDELLSP